MAIGNNSQLQTAIVSWLGRSDISAQIPDFIALAEARINRRLRVSQMLVRAITELTPGDAYIAKPNDFLELRNIEVSGSPNVALDYVTPQTMDKKYRSDMIGRPNAYTLLGHEIMVGPAPDTDYTLELAYYGRVPALADANTNWLIQQAPDVYLYGSLIEAKAYIEDEKYQVWKAAFDEAINDMIKADKRAKYSGSGLRQRSV